MFTDMKVGVRLIAGFLIVALLGAIVAAIGIANMARINDLAEEMYAKELVGLSHIKDANINLIYAGRARANLLLATSTSEREKLLASIKTYVKTSNDFMAKAQPLFTSEKATAAFAKYTNVGKEYEKALWSAMKMATEENLNDQSAALQLALKDTRRHADTLDALLTELSEIQEVRAKDAAATVSELYSFSLQLMLVLVVGSMMASIALGLLITRSLTRQLGGEPNYAAGIAGSIANGDLSIDINTAAYDKSSLLFAMRSMRDNLADIVGRVRQGTDTMATASGEIASGNQDLSSRTEQQASSLEETASSMEELTATVRQNADNARQANQMAVTASDVAAKGGAVVAQVVDTMGAINDSSKKIVDIIGVIDGIAFQTNILALNAAVEAARAGEQGRGFAVVATEVRSLAQRSAAAAKEIKGLISDSVEKVDIGSKLVNEAGATMEEVVTSIRRVTDIMGEITAASQEQSSGIEQVNQAIEQMDQVTQQNAALVEEAAAAAESLQDQAAGLARIVATFKLGNESQWQSAAPSAKSPAAVKARPPAPALRVVTAQAKPVRAMQAASPAPARPVARAPKAAGGEEWEEF